MMPTAEEIDPQKLFEQAPAILSQLAKLTKAALEVYGQYRGRGADGPDALEWMKLQTGNAVALIMKLRKET